MVGDGGRQRDMWETCHLEMAPSTMMAMPRSIGPHICVSVVWPSTPAATAEHTCVAHVLAADLTSEMHACTHGRCGTHVPTHRRCAMQPQREGRAPTLAGALLRLISSHVPSLIARCSRQPRAFAMAGEKGMPSEEVATG